MQILDDKENLVDRNAAVGARGNGMFTFGRRMMKEKNAIQFGCIRTDGK